jgi:hypothetical protein
MYPNEIFKKIIVEQGQIIGRKLAHSQALATGGITFSSEESDELQITGNPIQTLDKLVNSYGLVFGNASVAVCLDVIKSLPYQEVSQYLPESIKQQVQPNDTS